MPSVIVGSGESSSRPVHHRARASAPLAPIALLASVAAASARAQQFAWREAQFGTQRQFAMAYDIVRSRFVAVDADRTTEWDGTEWQRRMTVHVPESRSGHALVYDGRSGAVLMFGGRGAGYLLRDLWAYDGADWTQLTSAVSPPCRQEHAFACDLQRGRCVLFGGLTDNGMLLGDTWLWNGTAWNQYQGTGPSPRNGTALAYHLSSARLVLYGGADGSMLCHDTWTWNGAGWQRENPVTQPPARAQHCMTTDILRDRVVMFGGLDATTWEWDGHDWSAGAVGPCQRTLMSMATDTAGNTMLLGGQAVQAMSFATHGLSDQWCYDGQQWRREGPPGPPARWSVAAAFDTIRGHLVTVGCEDGVNGTAHVWEHDGRSWSEHPLTVEPAPVSLARMCFDSAHGVCVLFGGLLGFAPQAETWLWNGKSWRHAQTGLAPPPRFDYGMVFDAARRVVLLFGGRDLGASLQDTWTWNGAAWSRLQVAGPSARSALGMAYDSRRQRTVLFGGANLTGAASALAFGDTWEWDGAVWTRCQPAQAPSPRAYPTMAYDEGTHTTVCLGGSVAGVRLCEVWQWDGVQWTGGPGGPPSMVAQQLVYDRRRDQLVLLTPVVAGDSLQGTSVWIGSPRVATAALDGQRCGGALGLTLRPFGMPRVDRKSVRIDVLGAQYGQPVMLGGGLPAAPVAIGGGCAFWLLNGTGTLQGLAGGVGNLDLAVPLPDAAALLGLEVVFQAGALDPTAPLGFALSEGLRLRIGE